MKLTLTLVFMIIAGFAFSEGNMIGGIAFTVAAVATAFSSIGSEKGNIE